MGGTAGRGPAGTNMWRLRRAGHTLDAGPGPTRGRGRRRDTCGFGRLITLMNRSTDGQLRYPGTCEDGGRCPPTCPSQGSSPRQPKASAGMALLLSSGIVVRARDTHARTGAWRAELTCHNLPLRTPSPSRESSYQALGWVRSTPHLLLIFINSRMTWV